MTTSAVAAALANARSSASGSSRHDAHVDDVAAEARQHAVQRVAVAVVDLARAERRADRAQLVAGREERDAQLAVDRALRRCRATRACRARPGAPAARRGTRRAALQVLAREAPVLARLLTAPAATRHAVRRSRVARSCITTVSAPCGITRAGHDAHGTRPAPTSPSNGLPANDSPTRAQRRFAARHRDRRSARPSRPSPSCRGPGTSSGDTMSSREHATERRADVDALDGGRPARGTGGSPRAPRRPAANRDRSRRRRKAHATSARSCVLIVLAGAGIARSPRAPPRC